MKERGGERLTSFGVRHFLLEEGTGGRRGGVMKRGFEGGGTGGYQRGGEGFVQGGEDTGNWYLVRER